MPKYPRKPTPPVGQPANPEDFDDADEQHTPPPFDIDELIRRLWPLRKAGDLLVELQTKVEYLEKASDSTAFEVAVRDLETWFNRDLEQIVSKVDAVGKDIVDIKGTSGNNGKLGTLRADLAKTEARIEKQEARRWTLIVTAVGMILTAGSLAVAGGRWLGKLENRVEQLEKYHPPGKDAP